MPIKALFFFILITQASANAGVAIGLINKINGSASLKRDSSLLVAKMGMKIEPGDELKTDSDTVVKVVMLDRNIIIIQGNSNFKFSNYQLNSNTTAGSADLDLESGSISVDVRQKYNKTSAFQIVTPKSVVGVRGTEFSVKSNSKGTEVTTFRGLVQVGQRGPGRSMVNPISLKAGFQISMGPSVARAVPIRLESKQLQNIRTQQPSSQQPDNQKGPNRGGGGLGSGSRSEGPGGGGRSGPGMRGGPGATGGPGGGDSGAGSRKGPGSGSGRNLQGPGPKGAGSNGPPMSSSPGQGPGSQMQQK